MDLIRAAWQLAISSLAGRRTRSILLALAVALATALSVAVSASMDTMVASLRQAMGEMVGLLDTRLSDRYGQRVDEKVLQQVRSMPGVAIAAARFNAGISVRLERTGQKTTVNAEGIEPSLDPLLHPLKLLEGRAVAKEGE